MVFKSDMVSDQLNYLESLWFEGRLHMRAEITVDRSSLDLSRLQYVGSNLQQINLNQVFILCPLHRLNNNTHMQATGTQLQSWLRITFSSYNCHKEITNAHTLTHALTHL